MLSHILIQSPLVGIQNINIKPFRVVRCHYAANLCPSIADQESTVRNVYLVFACK